MTREALWSSPESDSFLSLSAVEIRRKPSKVGDSCGASRSMVADRVLSDSLSAAVSVSRVLAVNSPKASVRVYGEPVRDTGSTSETDQLPLPVDSRVSTRWPSTRPKPMRSWRQ